MHDSGRGLRLLGVTAHQHDTTHENFDSLAKAYFDILFIGNVPGASPGMARGFDDQWLTAGASAVQGCSDFCPFR